MFMSAIEQAPVRRRTPSKLGYGRFMQADPLGYAAGMNLYGYVHNDPVNFSDPTGHQAEIVVTGARFGISAGFGPQGSQVGTTAAADAARQRRAERAQLCLDDPSQCGNPSADDEECVGGQECEPITVTVARLPPDYEKSKQPNTFRPGNCITAGHMCLEMNPSGSESRRQCQALERVCASVSRARRRGINDLDPKDRGEELCYGAPGWPYEVCVQINPGGLVLVPTVRVRR